MIAQAYLTGLFAGLGAITAILAYAAGDKIWRWFWTK